MAYTSPELTLIGRAAGVVLGSAFGPFNNDSLIVCPKTNQYRFACGPLGEW